MKYLLIVEDDRDLREGLAAALSDTSLTAYTAADIASARRMLDITAFDLVLLDCNLPDGNGIDFCRELTSARDIAVVFLTIRDSELDEVTALRAGACDYLKKPFSLSVLRERINNALRRGYSFCIYEDALYRFDFAAHSYAVDSRPVSLSATEQKLLAVFCQNKGRLLDRATLNEHIWQSDEYVDDGALSVAVRRLRQKLGGDCIRTVYGLGYIWWRGRRNDCDARGARTAVGGILCRVAVYRIDFADSRVCAASDRRMCREPTAFASK